MRAPIAYNPSLEQISPDERKVHKGLARQFQKIISATKRDLGHAARGVHAKSHALLEGEIRIHNNLPEEFAQGVFAKPATYPTIMRISAIPGDPLPDAVSGPRGFALKILNVEGTFLADNNGEAVQDFIFASGTDFTVPTAKQFLANLRFLALTTNRIEGLKILLSRTLRPLQKLLTKSGHPSPTVGFLGGYTPVNPLCDRFGSQAPLRFGKYVAKLDLVPESESFRRLTNREIDIDHTPDAIRNELKEILRKEGGSWTIRAQLCRNLETNPIEDASVAWPEKDNPYHPVATLTVKPQESWSSERARHLEDELSFAPWHGLEAHRPLGNIMRARKALYPFSSHLRTRLNGCPLHLGTRRS